MKCPNNTYLYFEQLISMEKIALLIIYNHRYDKNIPILDKIYEGRFSYVYHVVPFYDGDRENVIAVYESSYYFQNYIAQAYQHIKNMGFTHYFVVADDMIINPGLNETNLFEQLEISTTDCYIPRIKSFSQMKNFWRWTTDALTYKVEQRGVEVKNVLPSKADAQRLFDQHHVSTDSVPFCSMFTTNFAEFYKRVVRKMPFCLRLNYPLAAGYADIFLLTQAEMPKFCQYCGAFAATRLFVEIAVPTAMILTAGTIKQDGDVKLKRGDVWREGVDKLKQRYNCDLDNLIENYPKDTLYIHPVKLSQWKSKFKK